VAGGHPHLSLPSPCRGESTLLCSKGGSARCGDKGGGRADWIRERGPSTPRSSTAGGLALGSISQGEGRGGSGNVRKLRVQENQKKQGKPNSSAIPQQPALVWKPAGLRLRVWAPLSSPTHRVSHSLRAASSPFGNPRRARSRDRVPSSITRRGEGWAGNGPWGAPGSGRPPGTAHCLRKGSLAIQLQEG